VVPRVLARRQRLRARVHRTVVHLVNAVITTPARRAVPVQGRVLVLM